MRPLCELTTQAVLPPTTSRLRIAYIVHDYHRHGGHARYTAELASRFKRAHDVHVFSNSFIEPDPAGITYHHVPAWRGSALSTILTFVLPATFQVRGAFDVVHAQGFCGLRQNVITAHFCQAGWFAALEREHVALTWKQRIAKSLLTGLERRAFTRKDCRVIAISRRVAADLADYYGRVSDVSVIYHGVDLERFHPKDRERRRLESLLELEIPPSDFLALYVGDAKKGAAAAIRAVSKTDNVRLLIVSGSEIEGYRRIAVEAGIEDRVFFRSHTKYIERVYIAADALLFPTVYDAYGMVISEAMASGLPVITSRAAGAAELITSQVNGLLTERAWDEDAVAAHLARLRDDVRFRQELGAAARTSIEGYTWDRVAAETWNVYQSVVANAK